MQNKIVGFAALMLLVAVVSGCFFATSRTTVKGVVVNYEKRLEGVEVTFGPLLGEKKVTTDKDGKFEITVSHRPGAMLYLTTKKKGYAQRERIEFPSFTASDEDLKVEMLETVSY